MHYNLAEVQIDINPKSGDTVWIDAINFGCLNTSCRTENGGHYTYVFPTSKLGTTVVCKCGVIYKDNRLDGAAIAIARKSIPVFTN